MSAGVSFMVSAPVWIDGTGKFLGGQEIGVANDAQPFGMVLVPGGHSVPGFAPTQLPQNCLFVKDKNLGGLYLNWTMAQWQKAALLTTTNPV